MLKLKNKKWLLISLVVALFLGWSLYLIPGGPLGGVTYAVTIPSILPRGEEVSLPVLLINSKGFVRDTVKVSLWDKGKLLTEKAEVVEGRGEINIDIPDVPPGTYEIKIEGRDFLDKAPVEVKENFLILLETDKPIYKPGQDVHFRILTLNTSLKPVTKEITLEIQDGKGIKIFKKTITTDDFGFGTITLPLSSEPNLGVFKANASSDNLKTQFDFRVEEYVLPKYEVKVEFIKDWFMVNEPIKGKVIATYSFGKPVKGSLVIEAQRYVGVWEVYTTLVKDISGNVEFELPPVGYVAGVPEVKGMGNLLLDIKVIESETNYEEKTSKLITVAATPLNIVLIPESSTYKSGLPFNLLVVTESPDGKPIEAKVNLNINYINEKFESVKQEEKVIETKKGKEWVKLSPPESVSMQINAQSGEAYAYKNITSYYSPSGNFIKVEQVSDGVPRVGEEIKFMIYSTKEASNFYYEVVGRGRILYSSFTKSKEIVIKTTHLMAPQAKLLIWQILPNAEVAADEIPFKVTADFSHQMSVNFSEGEVGPGAEVGINITTQGQSKVGLTVVDKSVYILAEKKLNLKQVFDELERLYMVPQIELHEGWFTPEVKTKSALDTFKDTGVIMLTNKKVPVGKKYELKGRNGLFFGLGEELVRQPEKTALDANISPQPPQATGSFVEPTRIRQFFPETWLFEHLVTSADGKGYLKVVAPDSITTWKLSAVGISKTAGLGVAEDELVVFQPFFITLDMPYSAIRGEEFTLKVAVYNYLNNPQEVLVELEEKGWFDLLDNKAKTLKISAQALGSATFKIRPKLVGFNDFKVTAKTREMADVVIQKILIEPEGVKREEVINFILDGGKDKILSSLLPAGIVKDSDRVYLAITSNYLGQTIQGLEGLLQMPFGCGEQNMILLAPNIFITKYLKESGELKAEIMAKAEKLMLTGYQRQLTYRRSDGSFSAFGETDSEGSLWLTAFVLKTFAQAKDLIYIDEGVLKEAADWIGAKQEADGSFKMIGFVHHKEMMGGVEGKEALTAYVATSLLESGFLKDNAIRAVKYLEGRLSEIKDSYTLAQVSYILELAKSPMKDEAYNKLMKLVKEDENGIYWGEEVSKLPSTGQEGIDLGATLRIENTAYALLALAERGDLVNASRAAGYLTSQRNSLGGYGSTQDTVVTLQALTTLAIKVKTDVNLKIDIEASNFRKTLTIDNRNSDVLQIVDVPIGKEIKIKAIGNGKAMVQLVKRFNVPQAIEDQKIFNINVSYDTTVVAVNDTVGVKVDVAFNPPVPMVAEMSVLDISVPTGFAPVRDSIEDLLKSEKRIKRYEVAGRKVIFYLAELKQGDSLSLSFKVKALFPVKALGVVSKAYSYYKPDMKGETLSKGIVIK